MKINFDKDDFPKIVFSGESIEITSSPKQNKDEKRKEVCNYDENGNFHCDYFYLEKLGGQYYPKCLTGYPSGHRNAHAFSLCQDDILSCPYVVAVAEWLQNCFGWKKP